MQRPLLMYGFPTRQKKHRHPAGVCAHIIFLIIYFLFFRNIKYLAKLMPIL